MKDLTIHATNGEMGTIEEFYFDDETWTIRYLVINTGTWLLRKHLLISPRLMVCTNWETKELRLSLTKSQIEASPDRNTQRPVSREHEFEELGAFGAYSYWGGPFTWNTALAADDVVSGVMPEAARAIAIAHESADPHLRSTNAVKGYHVEATDGEIGRVEDFIVDQSTWSIAYVELVTHSWWPGKTVLMAPDWVEKISWDESKVTSRAKRLGMRQNIRNAPEYIESRPITRDYENALHEHYGRLPYWRWEPGNPQSRRVHESQPV